MENKAIKGTVIDVRTPMEYSGGHAEGSVNIPLNELEERLEELKGLPKPIILCCASGARSAGACRFLSSHGIDCINAGPWISANNVQMQLQ